MDDCVGLENVLKNIKSEKRVRGKVYPSQCDSVYQCRTCRKVIKYCERPPNEHKCGEWKCTNCSQFQLGKHLCYQRKASVDIKKRNKKFIFMISKLVRTKQWNARAVIALLPCVVKNV